MRRCSTFLVSLLVGVTLTLGAYSGQNPPSRPDGDPLQALLDEYDRAVDIRTAKRRVDPDRADRAVAWSRDWIERVDRVLESDPDHPKWYMARHLQYELAQKLKQGENPDYATPKRILRDMIRRAEAGGSYNLMAQMDLCSECYQEWDRLWRRGEARPADGDETYDEAVKMQQLLESHWDELVTRIPRNRDHYQELRIAAIRSQAAVLAGSRKEYLRAAELYLQAERVIVEHFGDPPPEDSWVEQQREGVLAAAIRCYALGGRKDLALQVLDQQFVRLPRLRMLPLRRYLIDDFRQVLWPERGEPDYQEYLLHCLNTRPVDEDWLGIAAELAYVQSRVQTNDAERELAMRALTRVAEACERHPELTLKRPTVYANACEKLALLHFRRGDWRKAEHYALEYLRIEFEFPERFQSFFARDTTSEMKELLKKLPATDAPADSTTEAAEAGRAPKPIGDPQSAGSGQPSTDGSPPGAVGGDPRVVEQGERSAPKRAVEGVLEFRILANPEAKAPSFEEYHQRLRRGSVRPRYGVDPYGWFEIDDPVRFLGAKDPDGLARDFEKLREKAKAIVGRHGGKYYVLAHLDWEHALVRPGLNRWRVQQARVLKNPRDQSPAIGVTLDSPGAVRLGELHKHRGRVLAVLLDDRVISHFTIDSPLKKELVIGGLGSREEASRIVSKLNAFAESATTQPAVRPPDSRPPAPRAER